MAWTPTYSGATCRPAKARAVTIRPVFDRARTSGPKVGNYRANFHGLRRTFGAEEFRFYRSQTGPPLPTDTPFATSATLPYTPPDTFGDGTWWVSVSWYNGLYDSGFAPVGPNGETFIRFDIQSGSAVNSPPNGANQEDVLVEAGGVIRLNAIYSQADSLQGDQWAIAYTTDGSDPPADSPSITVDLGEGLSLLDYALPAQSHGTVVKIRIQIRRNDGSEATPVWTYSEGSIIHTATADAVGPEAAQAISRTSELD